MGAGASAGLAGSASRPAEVLELDTPRGVARAHVSAAPEARALLVLGHGAGGGVDAPDLRAAGEAALTAGVSVALVEQPYRVAGRRSPAPAAQLDEAWLAVVSALRAAGVTGAAVLQGGRSSGARVACRTAERVGAAGVLCLAFPLTPPARRDGSRGPSRLEELESVRAPVLVVQGEADRFGIPPAAPGREVVVVGGDHSLRRNAPQVTEVVGAWLPVVLGSRRSGRRESNPP